MVLAKCYALALDDSKRSNGKPGEESGMIPLLPLPRQLPTWRVLILQGDIL